MAATQVGISSDKVKTYVERWGKVSESRTRADYEIAQLAREVRAHFARGKNGDGKFRQWTMEHLGVSGPTASRLLRAVVAIRRIPDQKDWVNVGGWPGIKGICELEDTDRTKFLKACRNKSKRLGRPLSQATVRNMLTGLTGIRDREHKAAVVNDRRVTLLRDWMRKLYARFELPDMPEKVADAMKNGSR